VIASGSAPNSWRASNTRPSISSRVAVAAIQFLLVIS
jgi:hypothetical protein